MSFSVYISTCLSLSLSLSFTAFFQSPCLCLSLFLSCFLSVCPSLSAPRPLSADSTLSSSLSFFPSLWLSVLRSPGLQRQLSGASLQVCLVLLLCRPALPLSHGGHITSSASVCRSETEHDRPGPNSKPLPGGCLGPGLDHHPYPGFTPPPPQVAGQRKDLLSSVSAVLREEGLGWTIPKTHLLQGLVRLWLGVKVSTQGRG